MSKACLLTAAAAILLLGSCEAKELTEARWQLRWVNVEDAERDADRAVGQGDTRLYGVYGYSIEMHGAPEGAAWQPNGCGLKMIAGTSDVMYSKDTYERPRAYAKRYNERVIARTRCLAAPATR